MFDVRQRLESRPIGDLDAALEKVDATGFAGRLAGPRVAIAVGSRNIDRLAEIVPNLVRRLREADLDVFIIPAMGSHGGASEQGQQGILASLGITAESSLAPVEPSMETVRLGTTPGGVTVFAAKAAMEADGIVLVSRVGLHTGYTGRVQSGASKMIVVGLGKADGARALHEHGFGSGHLIAEAAALAQEALPPVVALALIEDGTRKLSELYVLQGEQIAEQEPALLSRAASMWPRIPLKGADLLIVEEMGKDISGVGMDPHVTGRGIDPGPGAEPRFAARRLVVLRLTEGSAGNATGIGHADITTRALVEGMDTVVTYRNVLTSGALYRARVPIVAGSDREAVEMALASLGGPGPEQARIVRIRNTRSLERFEVSSSLLPSLEGLEGVEASPEGRSLAFDGNGDLV